MTEEQKQILMKDLCGRLPYGVKASYYGPEEECECIDEIEGLFSDGQIDIGQYGLDVWKVKPYLFPLSSMTKEQEEEWYGLYLQPLFERTRQHTRKEDLMLSAESQCVGLDWLNAHHFDYRGLIEQGLVIDATGLGIYNKEGQP